MVTLNDYRSVATGTCSDTIYLGSQEWTISSGTECRPSAHSVANLLLRDAVRPFIDDPAAF
jgi:hypothetical protein